MIATPLSLKSRIIPKSCSTSFSVREDVGSSMMMTRALWETALAISRDWTLETERLRTQTLGSISMPRELKSALLSSSIRLLSTKEKGPKRLVGSLPSQRFSMTGLKGTGRSS